MSRKIKITDLDYDRLCNLIRFSEQNKAEENRNLTVLKNEIGKAEKVSQREISPHFVTMNSLVEIIDLKTERPMQLRLVYPRDANFREGKISVLSLLGSALLGYAAGSEISFDAPSGIQKIKINKVLYQPEAAGDYTV